MADQGDSRWAAFTTEELGFLMGALLSSWNGSDSIMVDEIRAEVDGRVAKQNRQQDGQDDS